jgi:hypothetical protein
LSNFYSHPGRAGGLPKGNYLLSPLNVPGYSKKIGALGSYVCTPEEMLKWAIRKKGKS